MKTSRSPWAQGYAVMNRELMRWSNLPHDPDAPVALHCCSPRMFRPIHGKTNIVATMWESHDFPQMQRPYLDAADAIIVPTQFCKDVFLEYLQDVPIHIVPLGYNPDIYRSRRRVWQPNEPFQWLNIGAPNARKGWDVIAEVWERYFIHRFDCNLYCKMTANLDEVLPTAKEEGFIEHAPGVVWKNNIVLDFRMLPDDLMAQTYYNSHAYLFPTAGEGFGLTLLEAMATALPCLVTEYSGVLDFTSSDTVKYLKWNPCMSHIHNTDGTEHVLNSVIADIEGTRDAMLDVMGNYHRARKMGRRAAQLAQQFTWERAGQKLTDVVRSYL
jgi:glycosyltransferase involved in cell wall biosynthesis